MKHYLTLKICKINHPSNEKQGGIYIFSKVNNVSLMNKWHFVKDNGKQDTLL